MTTPTYNISVTSAIITSDTRPSNIENRLYNVNGKLFFGETTLNLADYENTDIKINNFSQNEESNSVLLGKSRSNTKGTHTAVSSGNQLGRLVFRGSDGVRFRDAAFIRGEAEGLGTALSMPGRLVFSTTPTGKTNCVEVMRINKDGLVSIGYKGAPDSGHKLLIQDGNATIRTNSGTNSVNKSILFDKSASNTDGEHQVVLSDSKIGDIQFRASNGTQYIPVTKIHSITRSDTSTSGGGIGSGSLILSTGNNTSVPKERLIIHPDGTVQIGTSDINASLNVTSSIKLGSTLSSGGNIVISGDLSIKDNLYLKAIDSNVEITGITNISNHLSVSKLSFLSGTNISSTLNVLKTIAAFGSPGVKSNNVTITSTSDGYLNFGNTTGESGFGLKSDNGTIKLKNLNGEWATIQSNPTTSITASNPQFGFIPTFSSTNTIQGQSSLVFNTRHGLIIDSNVNIKHQLNIKKNLSVKNNVVISNSLSVSNLTVGTDSILRGSQCVNKELTVYGRTNIEKKLSVGGGVFTSGDLSVGGSIQIAENSSNLKIIGQTNITSNLSVGGKTSLRGNTNINKSLNVGGKANIKGTLSVGSDIICSGGLSLTDRARLSGNLSVSGETLLKSKTTINSQLSVSESLTVEGQSAFNSDIITSGDYSSTGTLTLSGTRSDLKVKRNLSVGNDIFTQNNIVATNLSISGELTFNNVTAQGAVNINKSLNVLGRTNLFGKLSIKENVFIKNTLGVDGNINLNKHLIVKGRSNISSHLSVGGDTKIGGSVNIKQQLLVNNNLTVKGRSNILGSLSVLGVSNFSNGLNIKGQTNVDGSLSVTNDIFLGGALTLTGSLDFKAITGDLSIGGKVNLKKSLEVKSDVNIGKNLSVKGKAIVFGTSTISNSNSTFAFEDVIDATNLMFAMGTSAIAQGDMSRSIGYETRSRGVHSTSIGLRGTSSSFGETVLGINPTSHPAGFQSDAYALGDRLFVIGNGTDSSNRSNAFEIVKSGNAKLFGNLNVVKGLRVTGVSNLLKTLSVQGISYLSNLSVSNKANIGSDLRVGGYLNVSKNISVAGNVYVRGDVLAVNATSDLSVEASAVIGGKTNIGGGLNVTGKTNLNGTLSINGEVNLKSNLFVNGPILKVPRGNTVSRPSYSALGYLRYNTETSQFEGYGAGNQWGSLGGVIDVDQDTKITAETNVNDEDKLRFFTAGVERLQIDNLGNTNLSGSLSVGGDINFNSLRVDNKLNISKNLDVGKNANIVGTLSIGGNTILSSELSVNSATKLNSTLSVNTSLALGLHSVASGSYAVGMGQGANASNSYSLAVGSTVTAEGISSISLGSMNSSTGSSSVTIGDNLKSKSYGEVALGVYNKDVSALNTTGFNSNDRLFVIGNGTSSSRSDALVMLKNANTTLSGSMNINKGLNVSGIANFKSNLSIAGHLRLELSTQNRLDDTDAVLIRSSDGRSANLKVVGPVTVTHDLFKNSGETNGFGDNSNHFHTVQTINRITQTTGEGSANERVQEQYYAIEENNLKNSKAAFWNWHRVSKEVSSTSVSLSNLSGWDVSSIQNSSNRLATSQVSFPAGGAEATTFTFDTAENNPFTQNDLLRITININFAGAIVAATNFSKVTGISGNTATVVLYTGNYKSTDEVANGNSQTAITTGFSIKKIDTSQYMPLSTGTGIDVQNDTTRTTTTDTFKIVFSSAHGLELNDTVTILTDSTGGFQPAEVAFVKTVNSTTEATFVYGRVFEPASKLALSDIGNSAVVGVLKGTFDGLHRFTAGDQLMHFNADNQGRYKSYQIGPGCEVGGDCIAIGKNVYNKDASTIKIGYDNNMLNIHSTGIDIGGTINVNGNLSFNTGTKLIINEIQCVGTTSGTAQPITYDAKEHRFRDFDEIPNNLMVIKKTDGVPIGKVGINHNNPVSALHVVGANEASHPGGGLSNEALRVVGSGLFTSTQDIALIVSRDTDDGDGNGGGHVFKLKQDETTSSKNNIEELNIGFIGSGGGGIYTNSTSHSAYIHVEKNRNLEVSTNGKKSLSISGLNSDVQLRNALKVGGNANISGTLNVAGQVYLSGLAYPTSDGSANQVLKTNGGGVLSWTNNSGGGGSSLNLVTETSNKVKIGGHMNIANSLNIAGTLSVSGNFYSGAYQTVTANGSTTLNLTSYNNYIYTMDGDDLTFASPTTNGSLTGQGGSIVIKTDGTNRSVNWSNSVGWCFEGGSAPSGSTTDTIDVYNYLIATDSTTASNRRILVTQASDFQNI